MEIEGFRLENRVKPFDTAIICYFASFLRILTLLFPAIKVERLTPKHSKIIDTGHVFLYSSTSLIRLTLSILLSSSDTFLVILPANVTVPLQITVSSHYHKYIVWLVETVQFIILIPSLPGLGLTSIFDAEGIHDNFI